MRPPTQRQGALSAPFNAIFGTESNVRVLRILSMLDHPLSATEVARRTALQVSGVRRTLHELVETGLVEFVGIGARQHVQLRADHPLTDAVHALFRAEADRVRAVYDGITTAVQRAHPSPHAVWVEGAVATNTDQFNDPLTLGVLANAPDIGHVVEHLQETLAVVEREQDVTIDIHGWTVPDLQAMSEDDTVRLNAARPLFGPPPETFLSGRAAQAWRKRRNVIVHGDLDARARALAIAIGHKLAQDPSLISRTKVRLAALIEKAAPYEQRELREWLRILDTTSLPRLRRLLADPGERGTRLRQSLPFLDVLTSEERDRAIHGTG